MKSWRRGYPRSLDSQDNQIEIIKLYYEDKINKIKKGDELPPGVLKTIKVYVAMKRKIAVGDKISGRHGNKGIVSVILPEEDMPFTDDGIAVDVVLNPLGVPSRMNAGQILETHLGWASKRAWPKDMGKLIDDLTAPSAIRKWMKELSRRREMDKFLEKLTDDELIELGNQMQRRRATCQCPSLTAPKKRRSGELFTMAGLPDTRQITLYDGRTGEPFHHKVTIGYMYLSEAAPPRG